MTSERIVLPGQYIMPAYKLNDSSKHIERYFPSKGTVITQIEDSSHEKIPVVVATILGRVIISKIEPEVSEKDDTEAPSDSEVKFDNSQTEITSFVVSVVPKANSYVNYEQEFKNFKESASISINLPKENDVVLVKITKITSRQAYCEILTVEGFGNVLQDSGVGANGELAHGSVPYGGGSQAFSSHQTVASSQSTLTSAVTNDLGENFKGIIRSQDVRSTDRDKVKIIESFKPGDIARAIIISLGDGSNYYLSTARNDLGVLFAKSENGSGDLMFPIDWQTMIDRSSGVVEKRKCAKPFRD